MLGEVDDGLRQFAVARLEQLLEQADALFDGNLEDLADHQLVFPKLFSGQVDERRVDAVDQRMKRGFTELNE